MPDATMDACCLIDILVSGHAEDILLSNDRVWHIPSAVQAEVKYIRRMDAAQPGQIISVPADLSSLLSTGALKSCDLESKRESDLFVHYAAQFRSDGEAVCLALAESRSWTIATDDRKAIRIAQHAGLTVVGCPEIVKRWADTTHPDQGTLTKTIQDIQRFAQFRPHAMMPEYQWWNAQLP